MPRTQRDFSSLKSRAVVLEAARRCFEFHGWDATIRVIAQASGMTTGAIFAHWYGKEALYREAMGKAPPTDALCSELLGALEGVVYALAPPEVDDECLEPGSTARHAAYWARSEVKAAMAAIIKAKNGTL